MRSSRPPHANAFHRPMLSFPLVVVFVSFVSFICDSFWSRIRCRQVSLSAKVAGRRLVVARAATAVSGITIAIIVASLVVSEYLVSFNLQSLMGRQILTFRHGDQRGNPCDRSGPMSHEENRGHHGREERSEIEQVCCRHERMAHSQGSDRKWM